MATGFLSSVLGVVADLCQLGIQPVRAGTPQGPTYQTTGFDTFIGGMEAWRHIAPVASEEDMSESVLEGADTCDIYVCHVAVPFLAFCQAQVYGMALCIALLLVCVLWFGTVLSGWVYLMVMWALVDKMAHILWIEASICFGLLRSVICRWFPDYRFPAFGCGEVEQLQYLFGKLQDWEHWAMIVVCESPNTFLLELTRVNNTCQANCQRIRHDLIEDLMGRFNYKIKVPGVRLIGVAPQTIYRLALANPVNNTPYGMNANCQTWCQELWKMLDDLKRREPDIRCRWLSQLPLWDKWSTPDWSAKLSQTKMRAKIWECHEHLPFLVRYSYDAFQRSLHTSKSTQALYYFVILVALALTFLEMGFSWLSNTYLCEVHPLEVVVWWWSRDSNEKRILDLVFFFLDERNFDACRPTPTTTTTTTTSLVGLTDWLAMGLAATLYFR